MNRQDAKCAKEDPDDCLLAVRKLFMPDFSTDLTQAAVPEPPTVRRQCLSSVHNIGTLLHTIVHFFLATLALAASAAGKSYTPVNERPPEIAREFRGAWIACIYNIDWPSSPGLSVDRQQAEMRGILDKMAALKVNAVIFQVRPQCDAVYSSSIEPWSSVLTGTMGRSPGYDPLAYCIQQAHARGIEVHAWFNPFRALSNASQQVAGNHVTRSAPHITKRFGSMVWCDPAQPDTRSRALNVILDVVKRYDIDGVHLDDYFYPYPSGNSRFADGKSPSQHCAYVDGFVSSLYSSVKRQKPWIRVGISPFGIWRPGVPAGIEAGIESTATSSSPATRASGLKTAGWTTLRRSFTGGFPRRSRVSPRSSIGGGNKVRAPSGPASPARASADPKTDAPPPRSPTRSI